MARESQASCYLGIGPKASFAHFLVLIVLLQMETGVIPKLGPIHNYSWTQHCIFCKSDLTNLVGVGDMSALRYKFHDVIGAFGRRPRRAVRILYYTGPTIFVGLEKRYCPR